MIAANGWQDKFQAVIDKTQQLNVEGMEDLKTLEDWYDWLDKFLVWVPVEDNYGTLVYDHLVKFYYIFDQQPVFSLMTPEVPTPEQPKKLTQLSEWIVKYIREEGKFLDTPASLTPESLATFYASPAYHMGEYECPHGGWKTFNEWFARHTKPSFRPIAAIEDDTVIVAGADATFDGQWEIRADSGVTIKGLHWKISELLDGSPYANEFLGGMWTHSFLNTSDYHRQHAPVGGKIVEARVIQGAEYVEVECEPVPGDPNGKHRAVGKRQYQAWCPDHAGFEFLQTRGLIMIDNPIVGLVAIMPIGMSNVSSVIITAEVGREVQKGEEVSYFQFGGSDYVMLFQNKANVSFTAQPGNHYKVGTRIAEAYPVGYRKRH